MALSIGVYPKKLKLMSRNADPTMATSISIYHIEEPGVELVHGQGSHI